MDEYLLPGLPIELIRAAYDRAPGNELGSGKFASPESSAALAANTFGLFLNRAGDLPRMPGLEDIEWPPQSVALEAIARFPWRGGHHPYLDVLIETQTKLIGIESKRFEPYRPHDERTEFSEAYWRPVWGSSMKRYESVRDGLADGSLSFARLDAAQLVKHAFGLRTTASHRSRAPGKRAILYYLYAEPQAWADGRSVQADRIQAHRFEVAKFADLVRGDEVTFAACSYSELLALWEASADPEISHHARAVRDRFAP